MNVLAHTQTYQTKSAHLIFSSSSHSHAPPSDYLKIRIKGSRCYSLSIKPAAFSSFASQYLRSQEAGVVWTQLCEVKRSKTKSFFTDKIITLTILPIKCLVANMTGVCVACGQKFPGAQSSFLEKKELMFCLVLPQLQGGMGKVGGGRERWTVEVWRRMRKLDKEVVVWVRARTWSHCSPEMRRLYLPQRQLHRPLSGERRLGGLGQCAFSRTHEHSHKHTKR